MGEAFRIAREEMGTGERAHLQWLHQRRCAAGSDTTARGLQQPYRQARAAQPMVMELPTCVEGASRGSCGQSIEHCGKSSGSASHLGQLGAELACCARSGPLGRTGAFLASALTIGRFTTEEEIDCAVQRARTTAMAKSARALAAVGDVPGTASTSARDPAGGALTGKRGLLEHPEMAYSAQGRRPLRASRSVGSFGEGDETRWAPAWSARRPRRRGKLQIKVNRPPA